MIVKTTQHQHQQMIKRKIRTEDDDDHQHQSANSKNKKRKIISADTGDDEDGKDWTTAHLNHILSSYHLKAPLSPISDGYDQQHRDVVVPSLIAAASAPPVRIVPKQQQQFKMSAASSIDLLSSIISDQKKTLMTSKHQQNPSTSSPTTVAAPRPIASVAGVQFSVPFVGAKGKWIEQQRRNEHERRRQLHQQVNEIHRSPSVVSLLREVGDGFCSMSPSERRLYIASKFKHFDYSTIDVIHSNDNSEWD